MGFRGSGTRKSRRPGASAVEIVPLGPVVADPVTGTGPARRRELRSTSLLDPGEGDILGHSATGPRIVSRPSVRPRTWFSTSWVPGETNHDAKVDGSCRVDGFHHRVDGRDLDGGRHRRAAASDHGEGPEAQ